MAKRESGKGRGARAAHAMAKSGPLAAARSRARPGRQEVAADVITFQELRRAKYDFTLGDDARICKQLNDLRRILASDRLLEPDAAREALALISGPMKKTVGARHKALGRVMEVVAAEIGRGRMEPAREVLDDLMSGIFSHSSEGIHCWGNYRRRFECLFPEIIRYRQPLAIKLQNYNTLKVQVLLQGREAYRLEMEHEGYEKARLVFTVLQRGIDIDNRLEWWTMRASTLTKLEHKSLRIELPVRADCRIEFMGRRGIECRLDYGPISSQGAALYLADSKLRMVRVFCDGLGEA